MQIDDELIKYLEELSRLTLSEEERESTKQNLGRILGYIDELGRVNTEGEEMLSHPFATVNAFREDIAMPSVRREAILAGAPAEKDGYFKVPKTVE